MTFGTNIRNKLSGALLYVYIFQSASVLPAVFIFTVSGYMSLITRKSVLSFLFDVGISSLPRAEALGLSYLYRFSASELAVDFAVLGTALLFGIIMTRLLKKSEKVGRITRIVCAALIAVDLIIRLIPAGFNRSFGIPAAILGFAVRLCCFILIILDLNADRKAAKIKEES